MRVLALAVLLTLSCQPDGLKPGEELSYTPFKSTVMLDASAATSLGAERADHSFAAKDMGGKLSGLKQGQVVVAGLSDLHPSGLMRFVVEVTPQADGTTLVKTVPVPIQLAFKKLHVKLNRTITDFGGTSFTWKRDGVSQQPLKARAQQDLDLVLFDGDDDMATTNDQVRLHAKLGGGYEYLLGVDVDWGAVDEIPEKVGSCLVSLGTDCSIKDFIPELKAGFVAKADAAATMTLEGESFDNFESKEHLASVVMTLPAFAIGPLVFIVGLDVNAVLSGSASSRFSVTTDGAFSAGAELSFSSKTGGTYQPPSETHDFHVTNSSVGLTAKLKAELRADLSLMLYDIAGPRASLSLFTELVADRTKGATCFTVNGGSDFRLGLVLGVQIPGYGAVDFGETSKTWNLFTSQLAQGDCAAPMGATSLPPGAGADFDHLANPSFSPTSRAFAGLIEGHVAGLSGVHASRLLRSIDGRVVSTSPKHTALVKLNEDGSYVWGKKVTDLTAPGVTGTPDPTVQTPLVALPTLDAKLLVLTQPAGWMKVTQSGSVAWGKRLVVPAAARFGGPNGTSDEARRLADGIGDGAGGFFIVGPSIAPGATADSGPVRAMVLHVLADGSIDWSRTYAKAERHLYPVRINAVGDGLSVVGLEWDSALNTRRLFQLRLSKTGDVVGAQDLTCQEMATENVQPTTTLVTKDGNLLIGGMIGGYYRGLMLAVNPTGGVAFATVPWSTSGLSYFVPSSIAELPTSGFALAGTYVNGFEHEEAFLASADTVGRVQKLTGYRLLADQGELTDCGRGAVLLTDDGGFFSVVTSRAPNATSRGSLWAMKVFAKDGAINFNAGAVRHTNLMFANTTCTPMVTPFTVTAAPIVTSTVPMTLKVENAVQTSRMLAP